MTAVKSGLPLICGNLGERREFLSLFIQELSEHSSSEAGLPGCSRLLKSYSFLPSSESTEPKRHSAVGDPILAPMPPGSPHSPLCGSIRAVALPSKLCIPPGKEPWLWLWSFHLFSSLRLYSLHPLPRKAPAASGHYSCTPSSPSKYTHVVIPVE